MSEHYGDYRDVEVLRARIAALETAMPRKITVTGEEPKLPPTAAELVEGYLELQRGTEDRIRAQLWAMYRAGKRDAAEIVARHACGFRDMARTSCQPYLGHAQRALEAALEEIER